MHWRRDSIWNVLPPATWSLRLTDCAIWSLLLETSSWRLWLLPEMTRKALQSERWLMNCWRMIPIISPSLMHLSLLSEMICLINMQTQWQMQPIRRGKTMTCLANMSAMQKIFWKNGVNESRMGSIAYILSRSLPANAQLRRPHYTLNWLSSTVPFTHFHLKPDLQFLRRCGI